MCIRDSDKGNKADSPMKRRGGRRRKKVCVFCGKENNEIDYKDVAKLRKYAVSYTHLDVYKRQWKHRNVWGAEEAGKRTG